MFDLDPYIYSGQEAAGAEPEYSVAAFDKGKETAFRLREVLQAMGLVPLVKTSGKTGLHVFVPIERTLDFAAVREVAGLVGRHLLRQHPKLITMDWSIAKRSGKIFFDYTMNTRTKTLAAAYSPRGVPGAPVSMPLTWEDLATAQPTRFQSCQRRRAPGANRRPLARRPRPQAKPRAHAGAHLTRRPNMAARSISSLTVSFGLVAIPVKLYVATASKSYSFNLLHKGCGSRLKQQYLCIKEDVVVPREDMVKGYEFAKDQYVVFSPDELKALEEAGSHTVDITEFVPIESVDPIFFDKAYYLAPDKGGAKPYALFSQALRDTDRCALGRWASHGKQHIVMLRPFEEGLVMQQLLYADEVRAIGELEIPTVEVKEAELKLAHQLIEQQSAKTFDPAAYTDAVRAADRGGRREEGGRPGNCRARRDGRRRADHRPDGSAAPEPRQEGSGSGRGAPGRNPQAAQEGGHVPSRRRPQGGEEITPRCRCISMACARSRSCCISRAAPSVA